MVRLDGDLTTLQGYYLADEVLQDVARQVRGQPAAPRLTEVEAALVHYAVEQRDAGRPVCLPGGTPLPAPICSSEAGECRALAARAPVWIPAQCTGAD